MLKYIIKRIIGVIPTLIIVTTFVFFFVRLIPGDPARLVAAASKAQQVLGWQPRLGVEAIIESAWRWHREHPHGYGERQ